MRGKSGILTPIVRSFLCSTLRPSPGIPTTASPKLWNAIGQFLAEPHIRCSAFTYLHSQKLDYFFDIGVLLLLGNGIWLPHHSAESSGSFSQ
jgi:hypothetical protein